MRGALTVVGAVGLLFATAAPAAPPEYPGQLHQGRRAQELPRPRHQGGHHRRPALGAVRREPHQGRPLDAAPCRQRPRARDLQDRAGSLLLNVPHALSRGPATFCTRSDGAIIACSRKGCPDGWTRATPSRDGTRRRRPGTEHTMRTVDELARASEAALALVARQTDVREAEVFVSANSAVLTRLNYTSHIPCNGVEEPKVDRVLRPGHPGGLRHAGGPADRIRQRAERPFARRRRARAGQGAPGGGRRSRVRLAPGADGRARAHSPTTTTRG